MLNVSKYNINLFTKFAIIITIFLVVTMSVAGFVLIQLLNDSLVSVQVKNTENLVRFVAGISALPIEKVSYFTLHDNAQKLQSGKSATAKNVNVLSVRIEDNKGIKLNLNAVPTSKITVPRKYWLKKEADCIYVSHEHGGTKKRKKVGKVVMIVSLKSIYDKVASIRLIFIFIMLAVIFVVDMILMRLIISIVSRPLALLTNSAMQIADGNFDIDFNIDTRDEIGFLARAVTAMSKDLKQNFTEIENQKQEIKQYSEHLEERVAQRTQELHAVNEELLQINEQFMKELEMARRVQEGLIPDEVNFPKRKEMQIGSKYLAMESVGGDLYDVIRIGRNSYGFLIADVSGHGVPSALITTMAKVSFNSHARWGVSTGEICDEVNKDLHVLISDLGYYMTAYFGILNLETGEFQYTNCGHHPAILYRSGSDKLEKLDSDGYFIGIHKDGNYSSGKVQLNPGDRILLLTDGLIEARNNEGEFYDYDRLHSYVLNNSRSTPQKFVEGLVNEVEQFCQGREIDDDRAILYFEFIDTMQQGELEEQDEDSTQVAKSKTTENVAMIIARYNMLYRNAIRAFQERAYEEAHDLFKQIKEMDPNNYKIYKNLGKVLYNLKQYAAAKEALEKASKLKPDDVSIKRDLEMVLKKLLK